MINKGSGASRYADAVAGMDDFGQAVKGLIMELLRHHNVKFHTVDYRVKTEESARLKLDAPDSGYQGFTSLHDLLGLRVTCYFADEVDRVAEIIEKEFNCDEKKSVDKGEQLGVREFGYRSVHRVARMNRRRSGLAEYDRYKSLRFEIQIRTVVQHAWAEIEHDLGYKASTIPEPMSRRFSMLAGVLELVDYEFKSLRDELDRYEKGADDAAMAQAPKMMLDLATLASTLRYDTSLTTLDLAIADAANGKISERSTDAKALEDRLVELRLIGITSIDELREAAERWRLHILHFVPLWLMHHRAKRMNEESTDRPVYSIASFPNGIGLFYLCYVMGAEAWKEGRGNQYKRWSNPSLQEIWATTVASLGAPPQLPDLPLTESK
ncbi:GTP pyrophosphokinase family protein [Paenarthrobacter sp. NPDC056912]|uniref:GTP pyrophosphokinase n=1 Tax=Paenarthrobacter sp. NPDC056912 TaxID=3345965 RepID=UPI00366C46BB